MITAEMVKDKISPAIPNYYPRLKTASFSQVVLFTEPKKGIVVVSNGGDPVGYTCDSWQEENFKDFDGSVVLSNA